MLFVLRDKSISKITPNSESGSQIGYGKIPREVEESSWDPFLMAVVTLSLLHA